MAMAIKIARLYIRNTYAESLILLHIFFVQRVEHFKDNIYSIKDIKTLSDAHLKKWVS